MNRLKVSPPPNISNVAIKLAEDVTKQIQPHICIFEPTREGSCFHYRVCRAEAHFKKREREKVIAWAYVYKRRPRLLVSIICNLLGTHPIVSKLVRTHDGSYGQPGRHECQGVTYKVNDQGYHILLDTLVVAAKAWL